MNSRRALWGALILNLGFFLVELGGAWWTSSLTLLADAVHMGADVLALSLSLWAQAWARRLPTRRYTFGFGRVEILAALLNSFSLWVVVIWLLVESAFRLRQPHLSHPLGIIVIGFVGLAINLQSAHFLHRHAAHDLNVRSSYLHLLVDAFGSVLVIVAGVLQRVTGYSVFDPIAGAFLALFTGLGTWPLIRQGIRIVMEGAPDEKMVSVLKKRIQEHSAVAACEEFHVWTLGTQELCLQARLVLKPGAPGEVQSAWWDRALSTEGELIERWKQDIRDWFSSAPQPHHKHHHSHHHGLVHDHHPGDDNHSCDHHSSSSPHQNTETSDIKVRISISWRGQSSARC